MPKYRAVYHVDATGYSDVFEAKDLKEAKKMSKRGDGAAEWNRDKVDLGDVIKLLEIYELDDDE